MKTVCCSKASSWVAEGTLKVVLVNGSETQINSSLQASGNGPDKPQ
jgi:hypothetical protein